MGRRYVPSRAALQQVAEEADTLKLLRDTLESARYEASAKFVGRVSKCTKRYIERLLPGCDLSFSEDLALEGGIRVGVEENCVRLSRGTQEQLAVLTRIALADMLLEQGSPVSLILDDPLVYSDDARRAAVSGHRRFRRPSSLNAAISFLCASPTRLIRATSSRSCPICQRALVICCPTWAKANS
jgi:hypothetical protein